MFTRQMALSVNITVNRLGRYFDRIFQVGCMINTKEPSCVIDIIHRTSPVFAAGALKALVLWTPASRASAVKTS